jgi:hypothetical protein
MEQSGTSLTSSTTPTSLLHTSGRFTLPPNFFRIGKAIRITFAGRMSNLVTTPGTLTLDIRMGPTSNIIVYDGAAMQMSTTAHTNVPIMGDIMMTCRSIGGSTLATFLSQGRVTSQGLSLTAVADSTTTLATLLMPNTNPAVGTGFDSTVAMVVDMFGTFSVNSGSNAVLIHQFWLESLN